jgi:hypothetical protein
MWEVGTEELHKLCSTPNSVRLERCVQGRDVMWPGGVSLCSSVLLSSL